MSVSGSSPQPPPPYNDAVNGSTPSPPPPYDEAVDNSNPSPPPPYNEAVDNSDPSSRASNISSPTEGQKLSTEDLNKVKENLTNRADKLLTSNSRAKWGKMISIPFMLVGVGFATYALCAWRKRVVINKMALTHQTIKNLKEEKSGFESIKLEDDQKKALNESSNKLDSAISNALGDGGIFSRKKDEVYAEADSKLAGINQDAKNKADSLKGGSPKHSGYSSGSTNDVYFWLWMSNNNGCYCNHHQGDGSAESSASSSGSSESSGDSSGSFNVDSSSSSESSGSSSESGESSGSSGDSNS